MSAPLDYHELLRVRDTLQERWPDITFNFFFTNFPEGSQQVLWDDGPSIAQVRDVTTAPDGTDIWTCLRSPTPTTWALLRGPQLHGTHPGMPWDTTRIENHLNNRRNNGQIGAVLKEFTTLTLEDLAALADNTQLLAQVEIAVALGSTHAKAGWEEFDLWLEKGGWYHAGLLLDQKTTSESVPA